VKAIGYRLSAISLLLIVPRQAVAQDAVTRALEFERRGEFAAAATVWRSVLQATPGDLPALVGLERVLTPLGRLHEMTGAVQAATAAGPSPGGYGVAIRVWTAARQPDSARVAVEQWAALEPTNEMPYQEWGIAAYSARDRSSAKAAYLLGRAKLGRPDAMAAELGQIAVAEADYAAAAREWSLAIRRVAGYRSTAISLLSQVPPAGRDALLQELGRGGGLIGERLAATLLSRWGEPLAGARRLAAALPSQGPDAVDALQEALDELSGRLSVDQFLARAMLLELLADRSSGPQRARVRLDAAQAYADGGDQNAARRVLALLAGDPTANGALSASATSTLVGVLVDEGGLEEADRRFSELAPLLGADDRQRLGLRLAQGWITGGRLGRADSLLAADSTVEALAVRGRIALYRGDLDQARKMLREAGPFTGERAAATDRIVVLSVLQLLEADSFPALGHAFYRLELRDSTTAAAALEQLALTLPPDHGGAELLLLAGRVRGGTGQVAEAERLYRATVSMAIPASSAAAEFALADLLLRAGKKDQAILALEHLLVTWPTSAVVPQARRLLDVARGTVPAT
jgi:hypothetical protein